VLRLKATSEINSKEKHKLDIIKAMVVIIGFIIFGSCVKYAVDNVRLVPATQADVEVARIKAASDLALQREHNEFNSRDTNQTITERKQRCLLELKNTMSQSYVDAHSGLFDQLVERTCR
jgi:hypothetical protein